MSSPPFDPHSFQFYDNTRKYDHEEFLERFIEHNKVNATQVRRQLTELVYVQVLDKLNKEFANLPSAFYDNKLRWSSLLVKTKSVQDVFNTFTQKVFSSALPFKDS